MLVNVGLYKEASRFRSACQLIAGAPCNVIQYTRLTSNYKICCNWDDFLTGIGKCMLKTVSCVF